MADLNQGTQRLHQVQSVLRSMNEIYKVSKELLSESRAFKQFAESLQQADPKHPVMDESNTTLYSTKGMNIEKTQDLLKRCNIPSIIVENKKGELFVAVPKQFAKQANLMFGVHDKLEQTDPSTMTPENKALLKQLTSGKEQIDPNTLPQLPAPTASKYLLEGKVQAYETKQPNSMYGQTLAMELRKAEVPLAVVTKNQNQTMLMVHPRYAPQVDLIDHQLQKQPTELSHDAFVKTNLGGDVVHQSGLTLAQVQDFRESTRGSAAGYYVEKPSGSEQTYTVHYPADKAHIVAPKLYESMIRNSGLNQQNIESFMQQKQHDTLQIAAKAVNGEKQVFVDATNTQHSFTTDSMGMRDSNGKLVVSRNDEHFEAKVYAAAMRMKAPLAKSNPDGKSMEDMFTREEIMKAQENVAKSSPTQADVAAAKIATLAVQPDVTAPNHSLAEINQSTSNGLKGIANALESTGHALNPEELGEVLQLPPEDVADLCKQINAMTPDERVMCAQEMRELAEQCTSQPAVTTIGKQDLPLKDMEVAMEKQTTERVLAEEERHADKKQDMLHNDDDPERNSFDGENQDDNHNGVKDKDEGAEDEQRGDQDDGYELFDNDSDIGMPDIGLGD